VLKNTMPRYEILSEEAMETIDHGWRRIVSDLGIEFLHDEALAQLSDAGQEVDGQLVRFDPDWILEQVAKAPHEFELQARNPANSVVIGVSAGPVLSRKFSHVVAVGRIAPLLGGGQLTVIVTGPAGDPLTLPFVALALAELLIDGQLAVVVRLVTVTTRLWLAGIVTGPQARVSLPAEPLIEHVLVDEPPMVWLWIDQSVPAPGRLSLTVTPVASPGPAFASVTV
jgi:trimethylamine--corrinoid protein Co-methyltransferase